MWLGPTNRAYTPTSGGASAWPNGTTTAASPNYADVLAAVQAAVQGSTVIVPSGAATWTNTGVGPANNQATQSLVISGIRLLFSGGNQYSRVEGKSNTSLTVGTGLISFTLRTDNVLGRTWINNYVVGEAINARLNFNGSDATGVWMKGTVNAWNPSTGILQINVTTSQGSGTFGGGIPSSMGGWVFEMPASGTATVITIANNLLPIFSVQGNASYPSQVAAVKLVNGIAANATQAIDYVSLIPFTNTFIPQLRDVHFSGSGPGNGGNCIGWTNGNGGIAFRIYWDAGWITNWGTSNSNNPGYGWKVKHNQGLPAGESVWNQNSTMGTLDVANQPGSLAGGAGNCYLEDYFVTGFTTEFTNFDDNCRMSERYGILDNSAHASHGPDTSNIGNRHVEFNYLVGMFDNNGSGLQVANLANGWFYWRGGEGLIANSTFDSIASSSYGRHGLVILTVDELTRKGGPYACWSGPTYFGTGPVPPGLTQGSYPAPHQPGAGFAGGVQTQTGVWFWNITGTLTADNPAVEKNVNASNFATPGSGSDQCGGGADISTYIQANRDWFSDSTINQGATGTPAPKPGYVMYGYPHQARA